MRNMLTLQIIKIGIMDKSIQLGKIMGMAQLFIRKRGVFTLDNGLMG